MAIEVAKDSLEFGKTKNNGGMAEKGLELARFVEREKWGLGFGLDEFGE